MYGDWNIKNKLKMDTKHIKISDYNYSLPDERIAKFPIAQRDHSKLLVYKHGVVSDDVFIICQIIFLREL